MGKKKVQTKNNTTTSIPPIATLEGLIYLQEHPNDNIDISYNVLDKIVPHLKTLHSAIGMNNIKELLAHQIIYFLQDFQNANTDMLHMVITGPPGVGKTMAAKLVGAIYLNLNIIKADYKPKEKKRKTTKEDDLSLSNILNTKRKRFNTTKHGIKASLDDDSMSVGSIESNDSFISKNDDVYDECIVLCDSDSDDDDSDDDGDDDENEIIKENSDDNDINKGCMVTTRSDFVGTVLGETAVKTQKTIDKAIGKVLIIDEAYSLGSKNNEDSYAKEMIDTLTYNLETLKNQLQVTITGYEHALRNDFFAQNEGLDRRFPLWISMDEYNSTELKDIFLLMTSKIDTVNKWVCNVPDSILKKFFNDNYLHFRNFAGDIETLLLHIKVQHGVRVIQLNKKYKRIITIEDMINGMDIFIKNKN